MPVPVPPLKQAELPKRKTALLKMMGPGIVMAGIAIGSGELIMWPWITSIVGAELIWAAAIGIFLQLWINVEVGRWTVVTGESPLIGMVRVVKLIVYLWVFLVVVGKFLPGWARETGVSLRSLIFGVENTRLPEWLWAEWVWTAIVFAVIAAILFGPKIIYTAVERCIMGLVAIIVVGLIYVVWEIGSADLFGDMWRGLLNVGRFPDFPVEIPPVDGEARPPFAFSQFFGAVVFAGFGGLGNLYYAYYLREKKIGMGQRMPPLMSPTHKHEVKEMDAGYVYPESEENRRSFRDWMKYVWVDQVFCFWILGSFTMFLFIFGSLAVLHPEGLVPSRGSLVWDLAGILEESMGTSGHYLFLFVGMAALFSSQLGGVDGGSRIFADMLHTSFKFGRRLSLEKWYLVLVGATIVVGTASVAFFERRGTAGLDFLFYSALIGGFAMAVYVPLLLYMNLTKLPKSARPGWINIFFVSLASVMYIAFAVYTVAEKVVRMVAG